VNRRNWRRRSATPGGFSGSVRSVVLERTATLIRTELRRRCVDLAPVKELAPHLGVTETTFRYAVARDGSLGLCGPPKAAMVWCLPPGPVAAGFRPELVERRLMLVLPGAAAAPGSLVLSGRQVGSDDLNNLGGPSCGELGNTITRMYLMADQWLIGDPQQNTPAQRSHRLFELVARTWRTSPTLRWASHQLEVYEHDHGTPIATRFWAGGAATSTLEIVVWTDEQGGHHLVNVYPGGTHRRTIGLET
jgi:hypothetical protein